MRVIKEMFGSKKFLASVAGVIAVAVAKLTGVEIPDDILMGVLGIVAAYVVGQGVADHGKEATKIAAGQSGANVPSVDPK
jgi:hypothetical protein